MSKYFQLLKNCDQNLTNRLKDLEATYLSFLKWKTAEKQMITTLFQRIFSVNRILGVKDH